MTNFTLTNQLREFKTNRFEEKIEKLSQDLNSKVSLINANKLQFEKESNTFKNTIKQLNNEISELKSSKDVVAKSLKVRENEISEMKVRIKGIYDKNEKDRNKAKALFRRMFKSDSKQTSPADQKALDAII